MNSLPLLQMVRLKGRVPRDDLDAETVAHLIAEGLLVDAPAVRLTEQGRARLDELLTIEREQVDQAAIAAVYDEFCSLNQVFKSLVTDWQLKDGQPNTHHDPDYDAAVLARLDDVHRQAMPVVAAAAACLPRLSGYASKLQNALDRVHSGETMWFSRPLIDSYHTVWFELHEELILAAGRTRGSEDA